MDPELVAAMRRRYCRNCWESLQVDGSHRLDQPCKEPSEPISYQELGDLISRESDGGWL